MRAPAGWPSLTAVPVWDHLWPCRATFFPPRMNHLFSVDHLFSTLYRDLEPPEIFGWWPPCSKVRAVKIAHMHRCILALSQRRYLRSRSWEGDRRRDGDGDRRWYLQAATRKSRVTIQIACHKHILFKRTTRCVDYYVCSGRITLVDSDIQKFDGMELKIFSFRSRKSIPYHRPPNNHRPPQIFLSSRTLKGKRREESRTTN